MNKEVFITVKGLQYVQSDGDDDRLESINRGQYYFRNKHHYIVYEETLDDGEPVKNMIKFDESFCELTRKGAYSAHMLFEKGKKNYTDYRTPFGNFVLSVETEDLRVLVTDKEASVNISYILEMNYEHLAKCEIEIHAKPVPDEE